MGEPRGSSREEDLHTSPQIKSESTNQATSESFDSGNSPSQVPHSPVATAKAFANLQENKSLISSCNSQACIETSSNSPARQSNAIEDNPMQRFQCSFCGRSYARREHLSRHIRSHKSRSTWYTCSKCNRQFYR